MREITITEKEKEFILAGQEGHFLDFKSKQITPAKISKTVSAMANAEGGEIYVGIEEVPDKLFKKWNGFANLEEANGLISSMDDIFPIGTGLMIEPLVCDDSVVLKIDVRKSAGIVKSTDGRIYLRRGAQNLPQDSDEQKDRLRRNKGITSYEKETVRVSSEFIATSPILKNFIELNQIRTDPKIWLGMQMLLHEDLPTVSGLLLFAEEPQAILPKRSGIKIFMYNTSEAEGSRETLAFDPINVEGCIYNQIFEAVSITIDKISKIRVIRAGNMEEVRYPEEALHEIIANAVIHRDYGKVDDIQIIIYNNRIEVNSPGTLPAHITPDNILTERYPRNGTIVRIINKFPNPPNKDIGEGLNTAFNALRSMRLKPPIIAEDNGNVKVTIRHESLASAEEQILAYLRQNGTIRNREARAECGIGSENVMKNKFKRMIRLNMIEKVPGTSGNQTAYRLKAEP